MTRFLLIKTAFLFVDLFSLLTTTTAFPLLYQATMDSADPAEAIFLTTDYDLYGALNLNASASAEDVKKAYRRLALIYHPDKLASSTPEVQQAGHIQFQQIGYAYAVLSDEKRKSRYDDTGRTDEVGLGDGTKRTKEEWEEYFKELWQGEVSATSIGDFFDSYEGEHASALLRILN